MDFDAAQIHPIAAVAAPAFARQPNCPPSSCG
jgi:hypothetical protein